MHKEDKFFEKEINNNFKRYKKTLEEFKFNDTLASIWDLIIL